MGIIDIAAFVRRCNCSVPAQLRRNIHSKVAVPMGCCITEACSYGSGSKCFDLYAAATKQQIKENDMRRINEATNKTYTDYLRTKEKLQHPFQSGCADGMLHEMLHD